jgi:type IV pilus assembly protein PilO
MSVEGNYHNLGIFFDRVGRLSRLVNIGNIKISSRNDQTVSNTITASCVATTFVYVDTPVPAPTPAPAARGRK